MCALDPPWWVDDQDVELADLFNKQIPVEVSYVAVHERLAQLPRADLFRLIDHFHCL